jgi:hypothetical protein
VGLEEELTLTRLIRIARRLASIEVGDTQARLELRGVSNSAGALTRAAARVLSESTSSLDDRAVQLLGIAGADLERAMALASEVPGVSPSAISTGPREGIEPPSDGIQSGAAADPR